MKDYFQDFFVVIKELTCIASLLRYSNRAITYGNNKMPNGVFPGVDSQPSCFLYNYYDRIFLYTCLFACYNHNYIKILVN